MTTTAGTALQVSRGRWHLRARRELESCGCLWVIPFGNPRDRYRAFWCKTHRKGRGPQRIGQ